MDRIGQTSRHIFGSLGSFEKKQKLNKLMEKWRGNDEVGQFKETVFVFFFFGVGVEGRRVGDK